MKLIFTIAATTIVSTATVPFARDVYVKYIPFTDTALQQQLSSTYDLTPVHMAVLVGDYEFQLGQDNGLVVLKDKLDKRSLKELISQGVLEKKCASKTKGDGLQEFVSGKLGQYADVDSNLFAAAVVDYFCPDQSVAKSVPLILDKIRKELKVAKEGNLALAEQIESLRVGLSSVQQDLQRFEMAAADTDEGDEEVEDQEEQEDQEGSDEEEGNAAVQEEGDQQELEDAQGQVEEELPSVTEQQPQQRQTGFLRNAVEIPRRIIHAPFWAAGQLINRGRRPQQVQQESVVEDYE